MTATDALFWDVAAQLYTKPGVIEGTIFGFRCIRVDEAFVAMPANGTLWVKLPEQRVSDLIDSGLGEVCAPNGRPFREWVEIPGHNEQLWLELLNESIEFVRPVR